MDKLSCPRCGEPLLVDNHSLVLEKGFGYLCMACGEYYNQFLDSYNEEQEMSANAVNKRVDPDGNLVQLFQRSTS